MSIEVIIIDWIGYIIAIVFVSAFLGYHILDRFQTMRAFFSDPRSLSIGRLEIRIKPKGAYFKNLYIEGNKGLPTINLPREGNEKIIIENCHCGGIRVGGLTLGDVD